MNPYSDHGGQNEGSLRKGIIGNAYICPCFHCGQHVCPNVVQTIHSDFHPKAMGCAITFILYRQAKPIVCKLNSLVPVKFTRLKEHIVFLDPFFHRCVEFVASQQQWLPVVFIGISETGEYIYQL